MSVKEELDRATKDREKLVSEHNLLEQRKQQILQELLKLEGEVRILNRLLEQKDTTGDKNLL